MEEVRFTWDGLTLCEQTTHQPDQPNAVALTWDHRGHSPLAQTERILTADDRQNEIDRRFFAIATDLIGTPTELIDESGDIVWRSRTTLWGTTAWARDSSAYTPLRFPGQYYVSAAAETSSRLPVMPAVRQGGLRAHEARDFRHEMCAVLCRAPGDAVLICLRDLDVLDEPLEACIGIAPDVSLLVQHNTIVGWSLTDPAQYLTTAYADPDPPSPATRRLLTECLDLVTMPLIDDLVDGEPAALTRLRAADETLRNQREDRHRADALLDLIATYVEDYAT